MVLPPNEQNYRRIMLEGRVIGNAVVEGKYRPHFADIQLRGTREDRPRGTGLATYLYVIEEMIPSGRDFGCDRIEVSEDAKRVWETLRATGVAVVETEFVEFKPGKFRGNYIVHASSWKNQ